MKTGLKYATHVWLYHLLMVFVGFLFLGGMTNMTLCIVMNVMMLVGVMAMAYSDGAYNGEKACTLAVSLEKQLKEGRRVDDQLKAQVFNKKIAAWVMVLGAVPFLLISAVNAVVAPFYPEVTVPVVEEEVVEETTGDFDFDYSDGEDAAPVNVVNVAARLVFMPYVSTYTLVPAGVLNALFFLYSLPLPIAFGCGYLMGPKMRNKKLHDIARGKKRKMRNLKVHRTPRSQRPEV